jgi:hypothetical protein
MQVHDSEDGGSVYPHANPPGRWRIGRAGVMRWWRQLADGSDVALPLGRGPLREGGVPGRWWPDDFRYEPGTPLRRLRIRSVLRQQDSGWPSIADGIARLQPPLLPPQHSWSNLPPGTSDVAVGGHPARPVAFNRRTGETWWWDPHAEGWESWHAVCDSPETARLVGTPDGVLLVTTGEALWLLADHDAAPVRLVDAALGQPLATPTPFAGGLLWPANCGGRLTLWHLVLPPRQDGRADPARYAVRPQAVDIGDAPAIAAANAGGDLAGRAVARGSLACLATANGHVELQVRTGGDVRARWIAAPAGWRLLPGLAPWLRPDGRFALQALNDTQPGSLVAGSDHVVPADSLCATLGDQRWLGRRRYTGMGDGSVMVGNHDGGWLHPLVTSPDGGLMLAFADATLQGAMLSASPVGVQRAQLTLVSGNVPMALEHFFQVEALADLRCAVWRNEMLLFNAAESQRAVLLEAP